MLSLLLNVSTSQFIDEKPKMKIVDKQIIKENEATLVEEVTSNEDVRFYFHPDSYLINNNLYVLDYPDPQYYRIRILMDPCRNNRYDCCMNHYGVPEYPSMINTGLEAERVSKILVIGSDTEVSKNYNFVTEDGTVMLSSETRSADDYSIWDSRCISLNNPFTNCTVFDIHVYVSNLSNYLYIGFALGYTTSGRASPLP